MALRAFEKCRNSSRSGGFAAGPGGAAYGNATAGYGDNASAWNASLFAGWHNENNWLDAAASIDRGDDYAFDGGTVRATEFDRSQYRFGYGRRIGDADIARLMDEIALPINLEIAATEEMRSIALRHRPHAACIVPERREERTTEGGIDAAGGVQGLGDISITLLITGYRDPIHSQVRR